MSKILCSFREGFNQISHSVTGNIFQRPNVFFVWQASRQYKFTILGPNGVWRINDVWQYLPKFDIDGNRENGLIIVYSYYYYV